MALIDLIRQSGAKLVGVGCVVEKVFEPGLKRLSEAYDGPVVTLAKIDLEGDELRVYD